jgi:integrase
MMPLTMRLINRNGWWHVEIDRRTRRSLHTRDEQTARRRLKEVEKKALAGKLAYLTGQPKTIKFADFVDEFLEHSFQTKRPFTHQTDCQALRRALQSFGGATPLGNITRRQVDSWLAAMGQQVKRTSANTWFRHFKAAMSKAVDWKYLKENPCRGVKQFRVDEPLPRYLEKDEITRLLAAEDDPRFRQLWLFYLLTGCRRGEALQVRGQDIDWREGRLTVGQTKNRTSKVIWITPELEALLRPMAEIGRLFPWKPDTVTHHFQSTAARAGLRCRLHDLRHTYASYKAMAGVDLYTLKELLGHKDIKATQIYAHLSAAHLKKAAGRGVAGGE